MNFGESEGLIISRIYPIVTGQYLGGGCCGRMRVASVNVNIAAHIISY